MLFTAGTLGTKVVRYLNKRQGDKFFSTADTT